MNDNPDIRVLGPTGIEDHHAHLLRLDTAGRRQCTGGDDDRAVESHCLQLLAARTILIGAYVDGVLRAAIEIIPDRSARQADANFTIETRYESVALGRALIARAIKEARACRLLDVRLHGLDDKPDMVQQATAQVLGQRSAFALSSVAPVAASG
jgi:hypothetical protein